MQIPFPNKKYNIIYADPPWHFKKWSDKNETRKIPYDVMSKEEIKDLPVSFNFFLVESPNSWPTNT